MADKQEERIALARRAVACKGWQWIPGMLNSLGDRVLDADAHLQVDISDSGWVNASDMLPDLDDPATIGCLLDLVRAAWGNETISVQADGRRWVVRGDEFFLFTLYGEPHFDSEAHALVGALEGAP